DLGVSLYERKTRLARSLTSASSDDNDLGAGGDLQILVGVDLDVLQERQALTQIHELALELVLHDVSERQLRAHALNEHGEGAGHAHLPNANNAHFAVGSLLLH